MTKAYHFISRWVHGFNIVFIFIWLYCTLSMTREEWILWNKEFHNFRELENVNLGHLVLFQIGKHVKMRETFPTFHPKGRCEWKYLTLSKQQNFPTWIACYILFCSVQSLSCIWFFVTPWTAACQASLSVLHYLPQFAQIHVIESVILSNHLILCCPLLLLPSIFSCIMVFSNELALCIRWPKDWSFSFSISPSMNI